MTAKKPQRLVLSTRKVDGSTHLFTHEELRSLVKRGDELGFSSRTQYHVHPEDRDEELSVRIWAEIPAKAPRVVLGKVVRVKRKTNLQQKVADQLEQRQEDIKNGTAKGYVPPVNGPKRRKRKRKAPGQ